MDGLYYSIKATEYILHLIIDPYLLFILIGCILVNNDDSLHGDNGVHDWVPPNNVQH